MPNINAFNLGLFSQTDDIVTSSKSPTLTSSAPALNSEPTDDKVGSGVSENAVELGKKEDKINEEAPREKDDKDKESKSVMMTTLPLSRKLFTRKTVTTLSPSVSTPTSAPVTTTLSVSRHSNPTTTVPSKSEKLQKSLEALGGVNPTTSFGSVSFHRQLLIVTEFVFLLLCPIIPVYIVTPWSTQRTHWRWI